MSDPVYEVRALQVSLDGRPVLGPLDLVIERGSFLALAGPNGSGKTTLLRALTRGVKAAAGAISLEGRPVGGYSPAELARLVGVVPQEFTLDFSFTVEETAGMGRYPYSGSTPGHDSELVASALELTGLTPLAGRLVTQLSGGERQRALIAQTLAQDTPVLLLDEPLNNLDLNHQLEVMQLLSRLHASGRTIVVVLHDLNMAAQYCDKVVLLDRGRVAAVGEPAGILDPKTILEVFKVRVVVHRQGARPYITPLWTRTPASGASGTPGQMKVHVIGGGGAASPLIEELVARGFAPSVGIVSVFDSDYATAQRYELEVVSAPPFEPFPAEAVAELDSLVDRADVVILAPVFLARGNLAPLRTALAAARSGKKVIVVDRSSLSARDMSEGEATAVVDDLMAAGALDAADAVQAADTLGAA